MFLNLNINNDIKFFLPEIFFFFFILFLIIFFVFYSNKNIYKYFYLNSIIILLMNINLTIYIILNLNSISYNNIITYYLFINNNLILFMKIFLTIIFIILINSSYKYLFSYNINIFEFYILILISFFGVILILMAFDLLALYLAIEMQSLCFYILASINKLQNKSIEAGIKYFVLGSFSSSLLLFGIAIIYGLTGMTNFKDLSDLLEIGLNNINLNNFFLLGIFFFNMGIFFKLSIAPFHLWMPDVFDGSIKIIASFFSTLPKIGLIFFFLRFYNIIIIKIIYEWQFYFIIFVLLSWIFGILGALKTFKLNKLMAYSSINHIGFILLGIIFNLINNLLLYLFIYSIIVLNIFVIFFTLIKKNNYIKINFLNQLNYLKKINIILALSLTINLFSLAGIPPLAGFFGKFFIFLDIFNNKLYLLVLIGLILSTVSCFYYLRLIKLVNFNNFNNWLFLIEISKKTSYFISIGLIFNFIFIFFLPFSLEFFKFLSLTLY